MWFVQCEWKGEVHDRLAFQSCRNRRQRKDDQRKNNPKRGESTICGVVTLFGVFSCLRYWLSFIISVLIKVLLIGNHGMFVRWFNCRCGSFAKRITHHGRVVL